MLYLEPFEDFRRTGENQTEYIKILKAGSDIEVGTPARLEQQ